MLIDITDEKNFPPELKNVAYTYFDKMPSDVKATIKSESITYSDDVRCAIEDYLAPFKADSLYREVMSTLHGKDLISYHATKIFDVGAINKDGLLTNTWDRYRNLICTTLQKLKVDDADVSKAVEIIHAEYIRKYMNNDRNSQLCFFSSMRVFENDDGTAGFDQFCENIGGELARWALKDKMPEVYAALKNNGNAIIVKVALPYDDLMSFLYETVAYQFISYYAAKYFWNFEYEIDYDCITEKDVSPDKILEVIPFTKAIDY